MRSIRLEHILEESIRFHMKNIETKKIQINSILEPIDDILGISIDELRLKIYNAMHQSSLQHSVPLCILRITFIYFLE